MVSKSDSQLLIIFDLDGTLIQSDIDYMGIRDEVRNILKQSISEEDFLKIKNTIYTILELVGFVKENDPSGKYHKKAWDLVLEFELKGYENAYAIKNVYKTLERLKAEGHIMVIYTNNARKLTDYALQTFKMTDYFEYVLTRDEVKNSKPDPEGIEKLIEKFGKTKESTIFIGDSWVDAETAINAGIDFVYFGLESAPGTRRKKIEANYTVKDMSELISLLCENS